MNVDLLDGDQATLEDSGDGGVLANQSILMRGLVVRSRGNRLRLRLRSRRPQPGSMLLRYQGESGVFKPARDAGCWGLRAGFRLSRLPVLVAPSNALPLGHNVVAVAVAD